MKKIGNSEHLVKNDLNRFQDSLKGKWYTLGELEDSEMEWWLFGVIDADFDKPLPVPTPWLTEEDREDFTPLIVKKSINMI
ncbi:hypothetical protein ACFFIF_10870 [Vagococcus entomophilus]|uniref:Uncharacterized protein n=1 Tax=Vagococcus entomophilus TaxID=1160095 RepID=A0A430AF38_9ENTE|nr:hypothetical protein [Vagococcus entomophilus]RSU06190.1 hypothetical protein CBF30_10765 [Vagococcus entomophilus]